MIRSDPYTPDGSMYECVRCSHREGTTETRAECSECGATVRNISVPRE